MCVYSMAFYMQLETWSNSKNTDHFHNLPLNHFTKLYVWYSPQIIIVTEVLVEYIKEPKDIS